MKDNGVTNQISEYVFGLKYEHLPLNVVEKTKILLLDYLGTTYYASNEEPARILIETLNNLGGNQTSTLIGHKILMSPAYAAFANGSMGHMAELDDTHRQTMSHPGDSIIAAALALAEQEGATGKEIITALVCGYDVAIRAGESVMPSHYRHGWHPSGTINTFGAAIASAKILKLDLSQIKQCLGIAGTQICGTFAHVPERGMVKDFNPGRAAFSGVISALLAKRGFTGATNIFENRQGFCNMYCYSGAPKYEALIQGLGKDYKIMEVAHKPYSACRHIHAAIDGTLELREQYGIDYSDINKVIIRIFKTGGLLVNDPDPWQEGKGLYGTRFSVQFNVALVAVYGKEALTNIFDRQQLRSYLNDQRIREFMGKIEVILDTELDKNFPEKWSTIVEIQNTNGTKRSKQVDYPKGEPENPVSFKEVTEKFITLCSLGGLNRDNQEKICSLVNLLDELSSITELTSYLKESAN